MKVIETISDSDIREDFLTSPIVKRITEKGEKKTLTLALNTGKKYPEYIKKKQSEIAKKRRKSIYKTLQNPSAKLILQLLKEGIGVLEIKRQTKCSMALYYRVKKHFDGGEIKIIDTTKGNHPQTGVSLTEEHKDKIRIGLLNKSKTKCPHCDKEYLRPSDCERHIKKKHKKILWKQKRELSNKKYTYMSPELCRDWLWGMGFFRGYDDPKYKSYVKNGGDLPKGFRTFPWVSEAETNSRFFNKRLIEQDNNIEIIRKMYGEGFSLTIISEKLNIPKTTLCRIIDKNNITSEIPISIKQEVTHRLHKTKKGRPKNKIN
jgi:DNA invertase Pin-like site-specific DNA recombinase